MDDLAKMILAKRDNAFGGLVNYMEQKYGGAQEDDIIDWDENDQPNKKKTNKKRKSEPKNKVDDGKKKRKLN
jgi:hypothetical protein